MTEVWRAIPGFEGTYEVSDAGRVRSVDRTIYFADGRVRPYRGQILAQYADNFGYPKVTLKKQDRGTRIHVHVVVASAFIGPRPEGQEVCHNDGNSTNCSRGNLRYDTPKGNSADKRLHGTHLEGEHLPWSKLQPAQVRAIRAARGTKTLQAIADEYGTSPSHVCSIHHGRRWAHIQDTPK